jgi:hypothetical protein
MTPVWIIEWLQTTLTAANPSEAVLQVGWRANATDESHTATIYSTCTLPPADPASFIPYSDLTQEQVLGWIWANGVDKDATEAALAQMIENQKNPPTQQPPLPWAA